MKKLLFNLILAGLFMNFGYPILVDKWRDYQFKNSDMEALKNMSADDLALPPQANQPLPNPTD